MPCNWFKGLFGCCKNKGEQKEETVETTENQTSQEENVVPEQTSPESKNTERTQ